MGYIFCLMGYEKEMAKENTKWQGGSPIKLEIVYHMGSIKSSKILFFFKIKEF
jgi:hypothetical protein